MADDVYNYIVPSGVITPQAQDIQTEVQNEYLAVFGSDLITTPNTPQGMLITVETLARIAVAANNANLANQINPNIAGGVFLDAIMALTGIQRTIATPSLVTATLTGVAGTIIPSGTRASETGSGDANIFQTISTVTIPVGGVLTGVQFQSVANGPVPCEVNTLTQIVTAILGWDAVTNPAAATLGQVTQSDIAARQYRRDTLFAQGSSLAGAITAAVLQVQGVTSMTFRENIANTTQVIDGVTMVAHSIYACVAGGTDLDVANAIASKKSGGANYNNGASALPVSQAITVPFSNQIMNILFDRPDQIEILVKVYYKPATSVQDPGEAIRTAILDYAAGRLDGEAGLIVGQAVSSFELGGAINRETPSLYIQKVEITKAIAPAYSTAEVPIAIWEKANIAESSILVVPV